jgi:hypothetical protein
MYGRTSRQGASQFVKEDRLVRLDSGAAALFARDHHRPSPSPRVRGELTLIARGRVRAVTAICSRREAPQEAARCAGLLFCRDRRGHPA